MNWDRIEGNWKQLAGSVKRRWSELVDQQLGLWAGKRDRPKPVLHRQARPPEAEHRWENEGGNPPMTEPPDANPRKHL